MFVFYQGKDVHAVNSYVVVTWQPPLNCDPFLSLPVSGFRNLIKRSLILMRCFNVIIT